MIDGKKIEEAAKEYAENTSGDYIATSNAIEGFKAGINWFLDNLWHDAKKKPEPFIYILAETYEFHTGYKVLMFHGGDPWEEMTKFNNITRWLYIEDLMKGGK